MSMDLSDDRVLINLELKVITPVHIGMGEKYSKLDFVYDPQQQKAGLLDQRRWLRWLNQNRLLETYTQAVERMGSRLDNYEWLKQQRQPDPLERNKDLFTTIIDVEESTNTMNDITRQLKDVYQQPFIPGSSIKGVLRTAIMAALIQQAWAETGPRQKQLLDIWQRLEQMISDPAARMSLISSEAQTLVREIEGLFFKEILDGNGKPLKRELADPFRGLLVSDSRPFAPDATILTKKHDLVIPAGKNPVSEISLWRESIRPGSTTSFQVILNRRHLQAAGLGQLNDAASLIACVNTWRRLVLDRHENLLRDQIKVSPQVKDYDLQPVHLIPDYQLLTLGGGTGFQTKSLIYALAPPEPVASQLLGRTASTNSTAADYPAATANRLVEKLLEKQFAGKHKSGRDRIASPRTLKTTRLRPASSVKNIGRYRLGIVAIRAVP